jgi:hypothetical protein
MAEMQALSDSQCQFPQELYDRIIDYLHEDMDALAACALVHSSWIKSSRYHFFDKINGVDTFEKCEQFTALISSPNYITPFIRHIDVGAKKLALLIEKALLLFGKLLTILADTAPSFTSISFDGVPYKFLTIAKRLPPRLKMLNIRTIDGGRPDDLFDVLFALPCLETITLSTCFSEITHVPYDRVAHLPNLRRLKIESISSSLKHILPVFTPIPTLRDVEFKSLRAEDGPILGVSLQQFGSRLERLSIMIPKDIYRNFQTFGDFSLFNIFLLFLSFD